MSWVIAGVLVLIALWFLWRLFWRTPATAEPSDELNVREPLPKRPLNRSGAVAVEEPDDD